MVPLTPPANRTTASPQCPVWSDPASLLLSGSSRKKGGEKFIHCPGGPSPNNSRMLESGSQCLCTKIRIPTPKNTAWLGRPSVRIRMS